MVTQRDRDNNRQQRTPISAGAEAMGTNLERELIPLLEKLQSTADALYDSIATTMPIDYNDPTQVAEADKAHAEFDDEMALLRIRFLSYLALDGADLDGVADQFAQPGDRWESPTGNSVYCNLAQASTDVLDVENLIHTEQWTDDWTGRPFDPASGQWKGKAAGAFLTNFLQPFKGAAAAQGICAMELGIAAKALATGVERIKQALLSLCQLAIERFGGATTGISLTDVAPAVGAVLVHISGPAALLADVASLLNGFAEEGALDKLAGIGVMGGLIQEAQDHNEAEEKPIDIASAPTARELIPKVHLALTELDARIAELDDQINNGIEEDLRPKGSFLVSNIKAPSPDLNPLAYHQLDVMGRNEPDDGVVVSIVRLYYAGYRTLPDTAALYDTNAKICDSAHVPNIDAYFPRSVAKFNEAVGLLGPVLAGVRDDLTQAGTAIVTAAKNYEYVDTTEAAEISRCIADIPPPPQHRPIGDEHYDPPAWLNLPGWTSPTAGDAKTP